MTGYSFSAIYGMLVFLLGAKVTLIGRMDAAFYVTHYIKWFDGDKLTFTIDEVICIHGESLPSLSMERSLASLLVEKSLQRSMNHHCLTILTMFSTIAA